MHDVDANSAPSGHRAATAVIPAAGPDPRFLPGTEAVPSEPDFQAAGR